MTYEPHLSRIFRTVVVIGLCVVASAAHAGGMMIGDIGARAAGRSGAFTAKANDFTAIDYNPAMLATWDDTEFFLGNRFGYANEEFRRAPLWDYGNGTRYTTFDPVQNQTPWQLLGPILGAATDFGLEDWGFALGAYSPPGIAFQEFPLDGGQRYMLLERETLILYFNLSAAWKYKKKFGIGASFQWVNLASLKISMVVDADTTAKVVNPVSSTFDVKANVEGADHIGASGIFGLWYRPLPFLQLAASGRFVSTALDAEGTLTLETLELDAGEVALTRDGTAANDITFKTSLPMMFRFGISYIHMKGDTELFDIEADFVYETWQQIEEYVIDSKGLVGEVLGQTVDVGKIIVPKQWKGTYSARLGGDYNVLKDRLTLRLGGFYESAAAENKYAYLDFIASSRLGASAGLSVMFFGVDVSLAYMYAFELPMTVDEKESEIYQQAPGRPCTAPYTDTGVCNENYLGQPAASANAGTFISNYHFASLTVSYRF